MKLEYCGTEELETARILLRRFRPSDAERVYAGWAGREECTRWFPWEPSAAFEETRKRVESWTGRYRDGLFFQWGIVWKENGELIGAVNLHGVNEANASAETSYVLAPEYWGRGILSEALGRVLEYAFRRIGLNRVSAEFFAGNEASARVLEKNGMRREGVSREKYRKGGGFTDALQYGILKSDWEKESKLNENTRD